MKFISVKEVLPGRRVLTLLFIIPSLLFTIGCKKDKQEPQTAPIVETVTATSTASTTASFSGEVTDDGNSSITEFGFVYSSNVAQPTTADTKAKATGASDNFSVNATGLASGTKYYVRAYAINNIGTGYGEMIEVTTGNAAPVAANVSITGTLEVNKTVTANYTYSDAENNPEGATEFKWYMATSSTGADETIIEGASQQTLTIDDSLNGKFIMVSITPKATAGTTTGVTVKSVYSASSIGAEQVTFTYNGTEVTYGTITSSTTGKKWLDRNLGATQVATSLTDYKAYGDMFQWGRAADGHQGVTRTSGANEDALGIAGITTTLSGDDSPETDEFIATGTLDPRDWRNQQNANLWQGVNGINNPCPSGWRLPTEAEWLAEAIETADQAFEKLKLTYTGRRAAADGAFVFQGEVGFHWSSTVSDLSGATPTRAKYFNHSPDGGIVIGNNPRGTGQACRCVKN